MLRFWLHSTALSALIFCALLGVIHTQPYDDGGLRASLFTPGCMPPCFLDIRPGATTREEALRLLQTHPWVAAISAQQGYPGLSWTWNGSQPAILRGVNSSNWLSFSSGVVSRIDLPTEASAATAALVFGAPSAWYYSLWAVNDTFNRGSALYFEQRAIYAHLEVASSNYCPLTVKAQWTLLTQISMPALTEHPGFQTTQRPFVILPGSCK